MTKIDIFSGFLGAGKTTLIKKLIAEAYSGEKLVLIENEFGEINIDGGFLKESGIEISEMSAGCICCSLVGDFNKALKAVVAQFHPDRILIEPSGVGKLSDVIVAVQTAENAVPPLPRGSRIFADHAPLAAGDIGLFFVDGRVLCRQYCRDLSGAVRLLSLDRTQSAADLIFPPGDAHRFVCMGRVLPDQHTAGGNAGKTGDLRG